MGWKRRGVKHDVVQLLRICPAEPEHHPPFSLRRDVGYVAEQVRELGRNLGIAGPREGVHDILRQHRFSIVPPGPRVQLERQSERVEPLPTAGECGLEAALVGGTAVGSEVGEAQKKLVGHLGVDGD